METEIQQKIESAFKQKEHINVMEASQLLTALNAPSEYLKVSGAIKELNLNKNKISKEDFLLILNFLKDANFIPGFSFVIENELCGLTMPTKGEIIVNLAKRNVGVVFNLTEYPYEFDVKKFFDNYEQKVSTFEAPKLVHIPVIDNTPPKDKDVEEFFKHAEEAIKHKKAVAVHCHAGKGRTGVFLGLYMCKKFHETKSAEEIIKELREKRSGSICTTAQESFVKTFYEQLKKK